MKKLIFSLSALFAIACTDSGVVQEDQTLKQELNNTTSSGRKSSCKSQEKRDARLSKNAGLRAKFEQNQAKIAAFEEAVASGKLLANGNIEVPVVVNILCDVNTKITDARIQDQIKALNDDFAAINKDITKVPKEFQGVLSGHTGIQFKLVKTVRKVTPYVDFNSDNDDDYIKLASYGGIDATNVDKNLNIWVIPNFDDGTFGYSTFPEDGGGYGDGIAMSAKAFGRSGNLLPGIDKGRTLTHEVGHYFDLLHIWGDVKCGNDLCSDTPTAYEPHYGNPSYPLYETCGGVKRSTMFMNYMDYSDDASLYMFTKKQRTRMQAVIAADGGRPGFR
jgi:Pregnancy-associated plasma protein-A